MRYDDEIFQQILEQVRRIPVAEIIGREIDLTWKGSFYLGLCPFHPDNSLGSFKVYPRTQWWRCYADGSKGDGIKFTMQLYNIGFMDAVLKLAVEFGIIPPKYDSSNRKSFPVIKNIYSQTASETYSPNIRAPKAIIHNVYSMMPEVCGLSSAHKEHLRRVRSLLDTDMTDYFTFPSRNKILLVIYPFFSSSSIFA